MTDKMIVDQDSWRHLTEENRSWIMYKTVIDFGRRLEAVEKKSMINHTLSAVTGLFGGIASFFGTKILH